MSIKLSVNQWCENCPHFSPDVAVIQLDDGCGTTVSCDTTISCENEDRCVEIKKYLESEMKGEKKDGTC